MPPPVDRRLGVGRCAPRSGHRCSQILLTALLALALLLGVGCGKGSEGNPSSSPSSSTVMPSGSSAEPGASVAVVTTLAGRAGSVGDTDGEGPAARFDYPMGMACDAAGNLYVADSQNSTIRKITPAGLVTTLAGKAGVAGSADGDGSAARFNTPTGVACDTAGNLYVADDGNSTIREITPDGTVTTLAGKANAPGGRDGVGSVARFGAPIAIACDEKGNLYVCDSVIRRVAPGGVVTTLAGGGSTFGSTDGVCSQARFYHPLGIACDSAGNVYVADNGNHTIRKITPAGSVSIFAGKAGVAGSQDGDLSAARFNWPVGIAFDADGNLYVAEGGNNTIRKITPAGVVSTLAGKAGVCGYADGRGEAARFNVPWSVCSADGNLYVADTNNGVIRAVTEGSR